MSYLAGTNLRGYQQEEIVDPTTGLVPSAMKAVGGAAKRAIEAQAKIPAIQQPEATVQQPAGQLDTLAGQPLNITAPQSPAGTAPVAAPIAATAPPAIQQPITPDQAMANFAQMTGQPSAQETQAQLAQTLQAPQGAPGSPQANFLAAKAKGDITTCLLYTSPSPRD